MAKISWFVLEISRFFVMLVLLFLSEQCSQNNSPIIKTNPFKVTKCKKEWWIFRPKWANKRQRFFSNKDTHYKYTNKTNIALLSGIGIFGRSIQEIEWTNIKIKCYINWFLLKYFKVLYCDIEKNQFVHGSDTASASRSTWCIIRSNDIFYEI